MLTAARQRHDVIYMEVAWIDGVAADATQPFRLLKHNPPIHALDE
jgi:hypothetical protein